MKKSTWAVLVFLVITLLLFGGPCFSTYRDMTAREDKIEDARIRVEDAIQRRDDLIPHFVDAVKGYAYREEEAFNRVAGAQVRLAGAGSIADLAEANEVMESALSGLSTVVDGYPALKVDSTFKRLREELADAENIITLASRDYNEAVRDYNVFLKPFPNDVLASIFGFERNGTRFDISGEAMEISGVDTEEGE